MCREVRNINNSVSFITFLCENDNRIPIEYASEGIKKLIPVLHYLIQLGIDSAFLVSNINPAPNTEEEILKLSENLQTFLSKVKFQELSKENT